MTVNPEPTPPSFVVVGDWIAYAVGGCTCAVGESSYHHEPSCGYEPVVKITEVDGLNMVTEWGNEIVLWPGTDRESKTFFRASSEDHARMRATVWGEPLVSRLMAHTGWRFE